MIISTWNNNGRNTRKTCLVVFPFTPTVAWRMLERSKNISDKKVTFMA